MSYQLAKTIAVLLAFLTLAACAADSSNINNVVADNDPMRMICRNDAPIGSRLPKKTCKTAQEWEQIAEENQEARRNIPRGTSAGASTGGDAGRLN